MDNSTVKKIINYKRNWETPERTVESNNSMKASLNYLEYNSEDSDLKQHGSPNRNHISEPLRPTLMHQSKAILKFVLRNCRCSCTSCNGFYCISNLFACKWISQDFKCKMDYFRIKTKWSFSILIFLVVHMYFLWFVMELLQEFLAHKYLMITDRQLAFTSSLKATS